MKVHIGMGLDLPGSGNGNGMQLHAQTMVGDHDRECISHPHFLILVKIIIIIS